MNLDRKTVSSNVDLRGFVYALEPLLKKQRWQLQAAQIKLANLQNTFVSLQQALEHSRMECHEQSVFVARAAQKHLDPGAHRSSLAFLARLATEISELEEQLARSREARDEAQRRCVALHQRLELLEQHRQEAVDDHANGVARSLANAADSDWLGRNLWNRRQETLMGQENGR